MKEIIKKFKEERNLLEMRIIKINKVISDIKELYGQQASSSNFVRGSPALNFHPADKIKKGSHQVKWTPKIVEFIRKQAGNHSSQEIVDLLKEKYELSTNKPALANVMFRYKITCHKKQDKKTNVTPCEECHKKKAVAIFHGKNVCKRCYALKTKGEKSVERKEEKDPEAFDNEEDELSEEDIE